MPPIENEVKNLTGTKYNYCFNVKLRNMSNQILACSQPLSKLVTAKRILLTVFLFPFII